MAADGSFLPADPIAQCVQAGIAFLDKHMDPFWRDRLDVLGVSIATQDCILGQLFGSYECGKRELNLSTEVAITLGFDASSVKEYWLLTTEWKKQLK